MFFFVEMVKAGERYLHFKGDEYEVIAIGRDSDSLKKVVVYRGFYTSDDFGKNPIWVRDYDDFVGFKVFDDGRKVRRFERIGYED